MNIVIIISILLFIGIMGFAIYNLIKIDKMPVENCNAKVISKRMHRRSSNGGTSYYMTFEIEQKNVEFKVFSQTYYSVNEGDEGTLYYKGNIVVEFKKN